ncbi:hypothetical protein [Aliifodinibius salipaludis]|uniref:hypothetical protein n=1 Tax=Fodinibius salipaludis TaxID=2032627 RepID=UPI00159567D6|nr:hypothetical protein [Aliifodinibius salipaludis]
MYYLIGAAFCIGFVIGMAFGMTKGKKELATEIQQNIITDPNGSLDPIAKIIEDHK